MVQWRQVESDIKMRLLGYAAKFYDEVVKKGFEPGFKEVLDLPFEEFGKHADLVIESLKPLVMDEELPLKRRLMTVYMIGFVVGYKHAEDDDHN